MRLMQQLDGGSTLACCFTLILGLFAHITKSDIAVTITILAGITTILVNLHKLKKDIRG